MRRWTQKLRKILTQSNPEILNNIINYSRTGTRRVDLIIEVSYKSDPGKTIAVLQGVLDKDSRLVKEPVATIGASALADSSVSFVLHPWVKTEDYWDTYFELHKNIKIALDEAGRDSIPADGCSYGKDRRVIIPPESSKGGVERFNYRNR